MYAGFYVCNGEITIEVGHRPSGAFVEADRGADERFCNFSINNFTGDTAFLSEKGKG